MMRALHAIWVAAMTLALFSMTSFGIFAIWAWNNPAFPASKKCTILGPAFEAVLVDSGAFEKGQGMPPARVAEFVKRFNRTPPRAGNGITTVVVYQWKDIPLLRVVFWRGDCFANMFDMPIPAFIKLLQPEGDSI